MISKFVWLMKPWQQLGRRSGISMCRGIESIETGIGLIGSQLLATGRPPELIGWFVPIVTGQSDWRKPWFSTPAKLLKGFEAAGLWMSTVCLITKPKGSRRYTYLKLVSRVHISCSWYLAIHMLLGIRICTSSDDSEYALASRSAGTFSTTKLVW